MKKQLASKNNLNRATTELIVDSLRVITNKQICYCFNIA